MSDIFLHVFVIPVSETLCPHTCCGHYVGVTPTLLDSFISYNEEWNMKSWNTQRQRKTQISQVNRNRVGKKWPKDFTVGISKTSALFPPLCCIPCQNIHMTIYHSKQLLVVLQHKKFNSVQQYLTSAMPVLPHLNDCNRKRFI